MQTCWLSFLTSLLCTVSIRLSCSCSVIAKAWSDRTDGTRGNVSLCFQSYTDTWLCLRPRSSPPWCTLEAGYLWRPHLTGFPSYGRWCTTAPYTEASAANRNKVRAQLDKKRRDILCEVRAHEWWYLQLLVSSRFFFRVFIFFKILKESSHMFTFYPMCEVNYVILWLHFRFSCHVPSFLAPSLSTPVCVRAQVTS